jgi:hypothetical protein
VTVPSVLIKPESRFLRLSFKFAESEKTDTLADLMAGTHEAPAAAAVLHGADRVVEATKNRGELSPDPLLHLLIDDVLLSSRHSVQHYEHAHDRNRRPSRGRRAASGLGPRDWCRFPSGGGDQEGGRGLRRGRPAPGIAERSRRRCPPHRGQQAVLAIFPQTP